MYRSLELLLPDPLMVDRWLAMPHDNPPFNGTAPLDRLLAGQRLPRFAAVWLVVDIAALRLTDIGATVLRVCCVSCSPGPPASVPMSTERGKRRMLSRPRWFMLLAAHCKKHLESDTVKLGSRFLVLFISAFFLWGCETTDSAMQSAGKSEDYIAGFHDGRHSGMKEAGNYLEHMIRDEKRFAENSDYREGWLAGEQEGIQMQQQANAIVNGAEGYRISKEADRSADRAIREAGEEATKGIDTDSLKVLEQ